MPKKIKSEDNPWPDVSGFDLEDFEVVKDFPSPQELRKAKVSVKDDAGLLVMLSKKDMRNLERYAKSKGVAPQVLASRMLHTIIDNAL